MQFYRLNPPKFWGDYSSQFVFGFVAPPFRERGKMVLHRTGPFIPPIAVSHGGYVTDSFRDEISKAFPSVNFRGVLCRKVVRSNWHTWPRKPTPTIFRRFNEPGSFITNGVHDEALAAEMEPLWELILPKGASSEIRKTKNFHFTLIIDQSTWTGDDLFEVVPVRIPLPIVSERGRDWLLEHVPKWVSFEECEVRT